ncbi:MAG: hypothetical protein K1X57_20045 [Gemmataceae bacterium]|nr:hypothetical protein [Gemmataceae bacterium]
MVKTSFENVDAELWVHPGKLGIAQPSVCLFHKSRESGAQLLDAISELSGDARPAQRVITFRSCLRPRPLRKMKMKLDSIGDDLKIMHIGFDRDTATITLTEVGLSLLKSALQIWLDGGEDFGVSPRNSALNPKAFGKFDRESGELWFWGPGYAGP